MSWPSVLLSLCCTLTLQEASKLIEWQLNGRNIELLEEGATKMCCQHFFCNMQYARKTCQLLLKMWDKFRLLNLWCLPDFYISSNTVTRKGEELVCEKDRRTIKCTLVVSCTLQLLLTWHGYKMSVRLKDMLNKVQNVFSIGFLKSQKTMAKMSVREGESLLV